MYTTYHIRYRYRPELFAILGGQPTELTQPALLLRIIEFVGSHGLANYAERTAWLDTSDAGLRELLGIQDSTERFMMWDDGQRMAGWREVLETVHDLWTISTPQEIEAQEQNAEVPQSAQD
jgi:hypothetical protein